tara:strand:+ start:355 stop:570 length:216 start_codon:yes stop_codon:yes gene_type:complete
MKDDRGNLDLTKQIDNLNDRIKGMEFLMDLQKKQLWEQRLLSSQLESANNLLQGYKKVIQELSNKLIKKDK